jgi:hypothetical protein
LKFETQIIGKKLTNFRIVKVYEDKKIVVTTQIQDALPNFHKEKDMEALR